MWVWHFEIRAGNRLVKRDGRFDTRDEAIVAGARYLQDNEAAVMGLENLTVGAGQELIGGSDRKYTVKKKLTDAIDPQWVFYDVEEWDSGQVSKRLTAKLSHTQAT